MKLKRAIALVVVVLLNGSLANDHLSWNAKNDQNYLKDSISPGIDPPNSHSSRNDYNFDPLPDHHSSKLDSSQSSYVSNDPSVLSPAQPGFSDSDSLQSSSAHDSPHIRSVRNANDKLTDYLKHTSIVAHITNGIAIQNGLMTGKMTPNDVVGELLNFGSIPVPTIANFKKDAVVAVTKKLKDIQPKLDSTITDIEDQALKWNDLILRSGGLDNVKSLPGSPEYFTEVEKFKDEFQSKVLATPSFVRVNDRLTTLSNSLVSLKEDKMYTNVYSDFVDVNKEFNKLLGNVAQYKTDMADLTKYPQLPKGPVIFEPLEQMIDLIKFRSTFTVIFTTESHPLVMENIEHVNSLATASRSADKEFSDIHKLVASRASPGITIRKHTIGFSNGINDMDQLSKDARDPWIGKMFNVDGSKLNGLADGLEPLFKFGKSLNGVNEKLKPISTDGVLEALSTLAQFQNELTGLKPDFAKLVTKLFSDLQGCNNGFIGPNGYKKSLEMAGKVKTLGAIYNGVTKALDGFNSGELKAEMGKLISSLGFKDLSNDKNAEAEAKAAVEKLKEHDVLADMKELVDRVKQKFAVIPMTELASSTEHIVNNHNKFSISGIDTELGVYSCAQKYKDDSAKVSQALKAVQSLRALDLQKIAKVESAAISVSEAASGLSGIASIQDTMKKDAKEAAVEINKLPDSSKQSISIGRSVYSLNMAVKLRDLESKIAQLKSIDNLVQVEIRKIADQSEIRKLWGDHKTDVDGLEKALTAIKSFDSKLDVSNATTLGAYGRSLKELALLTTVTLNAKEKMKALETIKKSADPKDLPEIEEAQKTLKEMENLDLGFASHTAQYQSAPQAFQALHDFLSKFLSVTHNSNQQKTNKSYESFSIPTSYFYGGAAILLTLLVCIGTSIFFVRRSKLYKKWKEIIMAWVKDHKLEDVKRAFQMHNTVISAVDLAVIPSAELSTPLLPVNKQRDPKIYCNPATAVALNNKTSIHANKIVTVENLEFIATQAPMIQRIYLREIYDAALYEVAKLKKRHEADTNEDFWLMVMMKGPEFVVSLLNDEEMKKLECHYYPIGDEKILNCGRFTVNLGAKSDFIKAKVVQRQLEIVDKEEKLEPTKLDHFQILNWDKELLPEEHETALAVMAKVKNSKKPIIVHCADGTERTMSFIGLQYVVEAVKKQPYIKFQDVVVELCKGRWHGIKRNIQSAWLVSGVRKQLITEFKMNDKEYLDDLPVLKAMRVKLDQDAADLKKGLKDNIIAWINKNFSLKGAHQYNIHSRIMDLMKEVALPDQGLATEYLPFEKQRHKDIFCNPKTAVDVEFEGKKIRIHANHVKSRAENATEFIATQGPMDRAEGRKVPTCEDFWMMVVLKNSEFIVNLVNDDEMKAGNKCGWYYKSEKGEVADCGRFIVTTQSMDLVFNDKVKKRKLEVVDREAKLPKKVVTQYHYHSWQDHDIPVGHEASISVMEAVHLSEHPVIVHCSAGVGRSVSFIGLQYVYEEILLHPDTSVQEVMTHMRDQRWHGIQRASQSYWLYLGVVLRFIRKFNLPMDQYTEQYEKVLPVVDDMTKAHQKAIEAAIDAAKKKEREAEEAKEKEEKEGKGAKKGESKEEKRKEAKGESDTESDTSEAETAQEGPSTSAKSVFVAIQIEEPVEEE